MTFEEKTDEELVLLSLSDMAVFAVLIERYEAKLKRYIRRISSATEEDCEDILQEAFLKAYVNLNGFDPGLSFSSWMYRIVRNQVISEYRKTKVRPQGNKANVTEEFLHTLRSDIDIAKDIDETEVRSEIEVILNELDDLSRQVLVLKYLEGKDYQEISDILEKPMGTVGTLIHRAKKKFRDAYVRSSVAALSSDSKPLQPQEYEPI